MLTGIRLQANPTLRQKRILSQWMGCARYIWNAKCRTDKEQRLALADQGYYPAVNQTYSQYKSKEETPWLYNCPSVLLRNSVANWYETCQNFFKKRCGRPQHKKKDGSGSIYLTRELFLFGEDAFGNLQLWIGGKKHKIGCLSLTKHKPFSLPNSIYIKKKYNRYWVSFCYEDNQAPSEQSLEDQQHLFALKLQSAEHLEAHTIGVDRGIARPVQTSDGLADWFDLSAAEKAKKKQLERQLRRYQKKLSRQQKGSKRRYATKMRLSRRHEQIANIRQNFCHQTSRKLVDRESTKVIVFEALGTKHMTKRPKAKQDTNGKWLKNNARAKAGLNRAILDKNWHLLETFTKYKAYKQGKAVFKVSPHHTSQECGVCHHIHPQNRVSQSRFLCINCGHTDNADHNAAQNIKQRAIKLILHPGTGLSKQGVLSACDLGRGADVSRKVPEGSCAVA